MPPTAGYSGKALISKLGIKPVHRTHFADAPAGYVASLALKRPAIKGLAGTFDFIQLFVKTPVELKTKLPKCQKHLNRDGMLWVSWAKKTSPLFSDVTEDLVREVALKNGLVDVKVCAVDDDWSALKLVYRLSDR